MLSTIQISVNILSVIYLSTISYLYLSSLCSKLLRCDQSHFILKKVHEELFAWTDR